MNLKKSFNYFLLSILFIENSFSQEVICIGKSLDSTPIEVRSLEKDINNCAFASATLTDNFEDYKKIVDSKLLDKMLEGLKQFTQEVEILSNQYDFEGIDANEMSCNLDVLDEELKCNNSKNADVLRRREILSNVIATKIKENKSEPVDVPTLKNFAYSIIKNKNDDDCPFSSSAGQFFSVVKNETRAYCASEGEDVHIDRTNFLTLILFKSTEKNSIRSIATDYI